MSLVDLTLFFGGNSDATDYAMFPGVPQGTLQLWSSTHDPIAPLARGAAFNRGSDLWRLRTSSYSFRFVWDEEALTGTSP